MSSLLQDLTPTSFREVRNHGVAGDLCWCCSADYAEEYVSFRKDWCYMYGVDKEPGQKHFVPLVYPGQRKKR